MVLWNRIISRVKDAPTVRCFCLLDVLLDARWFWLRLRVRHGLRALREAIPALIDVVSWPAPLITNPAEASLAEPFSLIDPAPHAIQAFWWIMPFHENETDAAETTTVP